MPDPHILLLTSSPGIGKTTAIRTVAARLAEGRLAGFYTEELRTRGQRQGFRLVTLAGEEGVIAHVDFPHANRVGKYGVDVVAIDKLAEPALAVDAAIDVYLVDEIGKMECLSRRFAAAMRALLDAGKPVVATIAQRGGGFIAEVKRRSDAQLWELARANRDTMPEQVLAWLAGGPTLSG